MAAFTITIVPTLVLKNGKHTVRIRIHHNGETRYIPTEYTIDSEKEIKDGKIIKRKDKEMMNIKLKKLMNEYEERCESIPFADSLTCSQLLNAIKKQSPGVGTSIIQTATIGRRFRMCVATGIKQQKQGE